MGMKFRAGGLTTAGAATTTSGATRIALDGPNNTYGQAHISNSGTVHAFVAFGSSTVTAVAPVAGTPANGFPICPNEDIVITIPGGATHYAVITATGTATVYVTVGVAT